jgi:hypothetical protein
VNLFCVVLRARMIERFACFEAERTLDEFVGKAGSAMNE